MASVGTSLRMAALHQLNPNHVMVKLTQVATTPPTHLESLCNPQHRSLSKVRCRNSLKDKVVTQAEAILMETHTTEAAPTMAHT